MPLSRKPFLKPQHRRFRHSLLNETMTQHIATLEKSRGAVASLYQARRSLKLLNRLVHQIHLFIGRAHVVMSFEIFLNVVTLFGDAELFKELSKPGIDSHCCGRGSPDIVAT